MKLHIFTLNWNGEYKLKQLEPGLYNNITNKTGNSEDFKKLKFHWYIKDNGSTDKSVEFLKSLAGFKNGGINIFETGHNRDNFSQGMNLLFDKANPADDDFILLLNNDVEFADSVSLMHMYNLMQKTNAGIVGARLLYPGTNKLQFCGTIFSSKYNNLAWHYRTGEESDKNAEKNRYFQAVTAAVMLTKASSFRKINGLDPYLNWCFDDVDYCFRINQLGEKIAYCGETKIFHEESSSLKLNPVNKLFMTQNVLRFRQKWEDKYKIDHDLYLKDPNHNVIP